jgi:hypothetical protein
VPIALKIDFEHDAVCETVEARKMDSGGKNMDLKREKGENRMYTKGAQSGN